MRTAIGSMQAALGLSLACVLASGVAAAEGDAAAARTLFDEGRKLTAEKKYDQACPKFEESQKLDPGMGTLFNLADCWEHIGRTASAWVRYREVQDAATRAGQADREKIARERAASLEPKLSRLTIDVKASAGVQVAKDGTPFGQAQWGSAIPTDPGPHTITATAPGKRSWRTTVDVLPNGKTASVTVPPLDDDPGRADPGRAESPTSQAVSPNQTPPRDAQGEAARSSVSVSGGSGRAAGWVLGGAGLIGLAVGTVFGLKVQRKNEEADGACRSGFGCTLPEKQTYDEAIADAKSARIVSISSFAAGGAALAVGAVLVLTSGSSPETSLRLTPSLGMNSAGVTLRTSW